MLNGFFPGDRTFWMYHCSLMLLLSLIQGLTILAWGEKWLFDVVVHILWMPSFTLGLLAFRMLYRRRNWRALGMGTLIPLALSFAMVIALGAVLASLAMALPIFWDYVFTDDFLTKHDTTVSTQLARLVVLSALSSHLFASAWIFIYISVTTSRRAREAELSELHLQNSLKEAQLSNLANQLNPHFLFNSLNNIRFMIHENQDHAERSIVSLSEILRYSLQAGHSDKVTLGEELIIVRRYIEIVSLQVEDRLDVQIEVPERLLGCLVPPMSVQLLVENAFRHGIEHIRERAKLSITAEATQHSLMLNIKNSMPEHHRRQSSSTGIGLKNIEQRLHLLYGGQASINVYTENQEFWVRLVVPREENL